MASLVSMATAKAHLHIETDESNFDINLKIQQASAIVLDYLKVRSNTITSVSVANPTVITTETPHSLTSGATVTIAGTVTTPTVVGAQVVTVTGAKTFTVPVNVTAGQADAAGTVTRQAWTDLTAPGNVQAATLLMLTHLYEHRGDDPAADAGLWMALERLLMRQRDPALA